MSHETQTVRPLRRILHASRRTCPGIPPGGSGKERTRWSIRRHCKVAGALCLVAAASLLSAAAQAQLVECQQIGQGALIDAPGGCIEKSLGQQIGAGHGDANTPGSAIYLIRRDPARSIRRGRQLFQRKFTAAEGLGPRVNHGSEGSITGSRALGAGTADSCAACHGRPRGSAGFGGDVNTFPDSRDAPHLFGLGLIEMLADEITAELRAIRAAAIAAAQGGPPGRNGKVTRQLVSKGINFGRITANPDGSVDLSSVQGVDTDLRVKPFFKDGRTISMREFIIGAFNDEMGLQAWDPVLCAVTDPEDPQARTSPAGFNYDPSVDAFNRPPACDSREDPDNDGIAGEIDPALVDHLEFYLLNYFKPGQYRVSSRARDGLKLLERIGCTSCHIRNLEIASDRRIADVDTAHDPARGIFNELFAEAYPLFRVLEDGDPYPQLLPLQQSFLVENIFTDLKRHDLGPAFEERDYDGSRIRMHMTAPLWGVGSTAPYGHDGRSVNLDAVIRRHGGEAADSSRAYAALDTNSQGKILDYFATLVLFPPDDTASNLNPGDPLGDPQVPANHGSINLGVLFQIAAEGPE